MSETTPNVSCQSTSNNEAEIKHRTRLPCKMIDRSQISIWSILKSSIGKELSKISMPASLCEPLSFLQRIAENFHYCDLLNKACDPLVALDACKRMEYVAAYVVSSLAANADRLSKPFNPLLGETFEMTCNKRSFRVVCEQVSHHPPTSAFHAESINGQGDWHLYGSVTPKSKFWGKSIEVFPHGLQTLELTRFNEVYTWQSITCCVHNLIVGKLWFEFYGTLEIECHQTGFKTVLNFKPYSWMNNEINKFDGYIFDKNKKKVKALYGYWTHCVYSCDPHVYDEYVRSGKPLPMMKVDEHFNEISSPFPKQMRHNCSASSVLGSCSSSNDGNNNSIDEEKEETDKTPKFGLNEKDDGDEAASLANMLQNNVNLKSKEMLNENDTSKSFATFSNPSIQHLSQFTELWHVTPRPSYSSEYYSFNYFTMTLNELRPGMEKLIAPTDSRFRGDVRKLENADLDGASAEKNRLEEKQRKRRKDPEFVYKSKWFEEGKHKFKGEDVWLYNNKYWQRDYSNSLDLF